jgi:glc operon protein GlcG
MQPRQTAANGKLTTLKGGVSVLIDGKVMGAVGVGGDSGEQDAEVSHLQSVSSLRCTASAIV